MRAADVVVFKTGRHLDPRTYDAVIANLKRLFPDNRVAILEGDATLGVVTVERGSKRLSFRAKLLARGKV